MLPILNIYEGICKCSLYRIYMRSSIRYPLSGILYQASSIRHPLSCILYQASPIRHPLSGILYQASSIRHPLSGILYQASFIRHPLSGILYQTSSIRHPLLFAMFGPNYCKSIRSIDLSYEFGCASSGACDIVNLSIACERVLVC